MGRRIVGVVLALSVLAASLSTAGCASVPGRAVLPDGSAIVTVSTAPTPSDPTPGDPASTDPTPATAVDPTAEQSVASSQDSLSADSGTSAAPGTTTMPSTTASAAPDLPLPVQDAAGVNVVGCRSAKRPVLLLHGTFATVRLSYAAMIPALIASGRCVYGLDYGNGGLAAVADSAVQFAMLVRTVVALSGSPIVDVIGYSQGGLVLRTALRLDGIAAGVGTAVLLAPTFHGTDSGLATRAPALLCQACRDQSAGSPLLRLLDAGGDLDGAVDYAVLSTSADTVATPVAAQVPRGPANRVTALLVQTRCPGSTVDHQHLPAAPGVDSWVLAALDSGGHPPASALTC